MFPFVVRLAVVFILGPPVRHSIHSGWPRPQSSRCMFGILGLRGKKQHYKIHGDMQGGGRKFLGHFKRHFESQILESMQIAILQTES